MLLIIGLLTDIVGFNLSKKYHNTTWLINIYTAVEFSLLTYFFTIIIKRKKAILFIKVVCIAFISFWIINNVLLRNIYRFDYISQAIEFIFLLTFCVLYFFQKVRIVSTEYIYSTYDFWLVAAILMYCAGTFFSFFVLINPEATPNILAFEYITRFGNIFKSILITIAFSINSGNSLRNQPKKNNSIYHITE
ncbi:MAG: hypothetical protein KF781_10415 [Chitinophagaceae bacterium]|nr:hypothetical protein [Chitinophagaceae bacterium]MCW5904931.1 hypothetical protein [Chitinophagaceae bacterium]